MWKPSKWFRQVEQYILDRFRMVSSIAQSVQANGGNCQFSAGHNFNWEWSIWVLNRQVASKMMVAYMPITNKALERIYYNFRSRTGAILVPATSFAKSIMTYRRTQLAMSMVGDQNPGSAHNSYWVNFFGRSTPFLTGPEKNAKLFKAPVIYVEFHRVKRGYYEGSMEMLAEDPNALPNGYEITIRFARKLEQVIREHPANWLLDPPPLEI